MNKLEGSKHLSVPVPQPQDGKQQNGEVKEKKSAVLSATPKELREVFLSKYEQKKDNLGKIGFANALVIKLKAFKDMVSNFSLEAYSKSKAEGKKQLIESRVAFIKEFESVGKTVTTGKSGDHFGDPLTKTALSSKDPLLISIQLEKLVGRSTEQFGDQRNPVFSVNKFLEGVTDMRVLLGLSKEDIDVTVMEGLRDKFVEQGRFDPDRAVLAHAVDLLLTGLDREIDRNATQERYISVADETIVRQEKTTFLRQNDASVTAIRGLIKSTEGGSELLSNISSRMTNVTQSGPVSELAKSLLEKKDSEGAERKPVTGLKPGIKPTEVDRVFNVVDSVLDSLEGLQVSPGVRTALDRLADNIRGRIDAPQNGLTREEANAQIRSLYTSTIFLREVSSSLTTASASAEGRYVMNMATIIIQNCANGNTTLSDDAKPDPYAKQKLTQEAPALIRKMEDFLVNKFGMPVEVRLT